MTSEEGHPDDSLEGRTGAWGGVGATPAPSPRRCHQQRRNVRPGGPGLRSGRLARHRQAPPRETKRLRPERGRHQAARGPLAGSRGNGRVSARLPSWERCSRHLTALHPLHSLPFPDSPFAPSPRSSLTVRPSVVAPNLRPPAWMDARRLRVCPGVLLPKLVLLFVYAGQWLGAAAEGNGTWGCAWVTLRAARFGRDAPGPLWRRKDNGVPQGQ